MEHSDLYVIRNQAAKTISPLTLQKVPDKNVIDFNNDIVGVICDYNSDTTDKMILTVIFSS